MALAGQLAILAIPAHGRIIAAGIALPRDLSPIDRRRLRDAIETVRRDGFGGSMRLGEPVQASVLTGPATEWVTLTPFVREGYAGRARSDQRKLLRRSLRFILSVESGDDPSGAIAELVSEVELGAASFARDVPSAREWPRTAVTAPEHVRIVFHQPVLGPLIIGRDRRLGLGLMRAVRGRYACE
jgi:CRISPR-associated protein Csb2